MRNWVLALLTTWWLPTAGDAASPLLVFTGAGQPDARSRGRVAATVAPDGRVVTARAAEIEDALQGMRRRRAVDEAAQKAREGWLLIGHLQLRRATRVLTTALEKLAEAGHCGERMTAVRHDLAYALFLRGRRQRAASLLGAGDLDVARYPPPFVKWAATAVQADPGAPLSLTVLSQPAGATVERDCAPAGKTPLSLAHRGSALVRVKLAGYRAQGRLVSGERASGVLRVALEPVPPVIAAASKDLDALLSSKGHRQLVVWRQGPAGPLLRRYRRGVGWEPRWREVPRTLTIGQEPKHPSRRPIARWVLLGTSAASLAAGSVFGLLARSAAEEIEDAAARGAHYDERLAGRDDDRRAYGTAAYVLWGVGAAAAVATAIVWFYPSGDDSGRRAAKSAWRLDPKGLALRW